MMTPADGPLYVLRPSRPADAVKRALEGVGKPAPAGSTGRWRVAGYLDPAERYTFVGLLGRNEEIVDEHGKVLDHLKPGDTFVTSLEGLGKV